MKVCVKCDIEKEDNEFYLKPAKSGTKRLCSWCKSCTKKESVNSAKKLLLENPTLVRERRKNNKRNTAKNSQDNRIRAKNLKIKCVTYKGGKCSACGYSKYLAALDFHHIDPSKKSFQITGYTTVWGKIVEELDKCILLCSNCHRALHSGEFCLNTSS